MKNGQYREISGIDFQWPRSMPTKWSGGFYGHMPNITKNVIPTVQMEKPFV